MYISLVTKVVVQRGKQKIYSFLIQFEEIKCFFKKAGIPKSIKRCCKYHIVLFIYELHCLFYIKSFILYGFLVMLMSRRLQLSNAHCKQFIMKSNTRQFLSNVVIKFFSTNAILYIHHMYFLQIFYCKEIYAHVLSRCKLLKDLRSCQTSICKIRLDLQKWVFKVSL